MRNILICGLLAAGSIFSAPILTIVPTLGPDFATSANFAQWASSATVGLRWGSTPGAGVTLYTPMANGVTLQGNEFIESASGGFTSWQGMANPTGSFSSEQGTALYFGLKIIDDQGVASFSLSQLNVTVETYLGQAFGASAVGGTYRPNLIGVDAGGATLDAGQAANTLVKELYYVGVGFVQPLDLGIVGTNQQRLDGIKAGVQALADRTTMVCYAVGTQPQACGNVNVTGSGIPEPGTWALMGAGLAGLALMRRRRA